MKATKEYEQRRGQTEQQQFNTKLVQDIKLAATQNGWEFDPAVNDKKLRKRVREFFTSQFETYKRSLDIKIKTERLKTDQTPEEAKGEHAEKMAGPDVFDEDESDVDETKIGALDSAKVALLVEAAGVVAKDYSFRELIQLLELYARSDSRVKCRTGAVADLRGVAHSKRSYEDKTFPIISLEEKSKLATLLAGLPTHEEFIERVVADLDRRLNKGRMVRESLLAVRGKEILTKLISGGWRTGGNNEGPASVDTGVTKMGGLGVSPPSASAAAAASSTATQRAPISYKDMDPGGLNLEDSLSVSEEDSLSVSEEDLEIRGEWETSFWGSVELIINSGGGAASVDTDVTKRMGGLGVSPRSASTAAAASSTATQRAPKDMNPGGLSFSEEDWGFAAEVAAEIMASSESTKSISGKSPSHKKGRMHSPKGHEEEG
ncbi:hypothetical protein TrRE_jg13262 [Triparma retinervis]|uniref:Uncharacterized protein n=1 Tax=Triparma retinervis TaxID=2557542 RepID=A0A9W7F889_9STRA|nr:hypothetical protein TrRE_jg13262 [Triparma retinervis]